MRGALLVGAVLAGAGGAGWALLDGTDPERGCAIVAPATPYRLVPVASGTVRPGQQLVVEGTSFNDARTGPDGCVPDPLPSRRVVLLVQQGERRWELGTTDAGADLRVRWIVRLPDDLQPGVATLRTSRVPDSFDQVLDVVR